MFLEVRLYPHDCGNNFGFIGDFAGHQGDSERVRFYLYSYDLTTWYLSYAYYDRHDQAENETYVSGSFLQSRALDLGTSWASVAADEDKHGSWQGRVVGSSHCAGSEDDFCYGTCDCFQGDWEDDFANGWYDVPSGPSAHGRTTRPGRPAAARWRSALRTGWPGRRTPGRRTTRPASWRPGPAIRWRPWCLSSWGCPGLTRRRSSAGR